MAYATIEEIHRYLDLDTDKPSDDVLLLEVLDDAQSWIDVETGRTFEAVTESRYFDAVADVDGALLFLDQDLISVSSITNGDGTTVTAGQYVLRPTNMTPKFAIKLLSSSGVRWTYQDDSEEAIEVAGDWGYSTTAPNPIRRATVRLAAWLYKQRDSYQETLLSPLVGGGTVHTPNRLPRDVAGLIMPYKKLITGGVSGE